MTITSSQNNGDAVPRYSCGQFLDDAATPAALVINLGYTPRYFRWVNGTDRIQYEWFAGMVAGTSLKTVAAGTVTLDTGDAAISVDSGTGSVTVAAAAILQNKANYWVAQ